MASSKEYGSVFLSGGKGGPVTSSLKAPGSLSTWSDWRKGGNTNANEAAADIMKRWDKTRMKQFEIFMDRFYQNKTPWRQDWLDRTAPGWKSNEGKILKCKMELIRRIIKIKLVGPESLEDWILLFLYTTNELDIPENVESLLRPDRAILTPEEFLRQEERDPKFDNLFVRPPVMSEKYPTNMPMWGFERISLPVNPNDAKLYKPTIDHVLNPNINPVLDAQSQLEKLRRANKFPYGTSVINQPRIPGVPGRPTTRMNRTVDAYR